MPQAVVKIDKSCIYLNQKKILTYVFMFPECVIQVMHCDYFMEWSCLPPEAHLGQAHYSIHLVNIKWLGLQNVIIGVVSMYILF